MGRVDRVKLVMQIVVFFNVLFIVGLFFFEKNPDVKIILSKIGLLNILAFIILLVWNKWVWKWKPINKLLINMPILEGCWNGQIKNVMEENNIQDCVIKIEQTYFDIKIRVEVERANSYTIVGDLLKVGDEWKLIWTWEGLNKENSFYGTTIVNVKENILEGFYFTNFEFNIGTNECQCTCKCTSGSFKAIKVS